MTEEQPNFEVVSGDEVLRRYKEAGITAQPVEFDEAEVPALLRRLTPLAREWGIGDDVLREHEVRTTSAEVLADVARAVREVEDELLAWLTSDAALSEAPTAAYVAFTNLLLVADATPRERDV